jgi:hypothetical protein
LRTEASNSGPGLCRIDKFCDRDIVATARRAASINTRQNGKKRSSVVNRTESRICDVALDQGPAP